jgi:hypothetical protein
LNWITVRRGVGQPPAAEPLVYESKTGPPCCGCEKDPGAAPALKDSPIVSCWHTATFAPHAVVLTVAQTFSVYELPFGSVTW